jgi:probable rRNA maturation factor
VSVVVEVIAPSELGQVRGPAIDLVRAVLAAEEVSGAVTVAFVDAQRMTELNRSFRGLDGPTDVLSFRQADCATEWPDPAGESQTELGEMVVCAEVVRRYASEEGGDPATQLGWTVVHGALHLVGYDHERDEGQMRVREQALLTQLDIQVRSVSAAAGK